MARPRREQDAALQRVHDRIPALPDCDGRCWISCGPVGMSVRERQRIAGSGHRITPALEAMAKRETYWCEALTSEKRCAVYALRPTLCRLWGAVESMPCPYGCKPEGGYLTDDEGYGLLAEAMRAGGSPRDADRIQAVLAPELRPALEAFIERGWAGDLRRAREYGGGVQ